MYKLETKIPFDKLLTEANLAKLLTEGDLQMIGRTVVSDYRADRASRSEWEQKMSEAMKLALQVEEQKNFPWTNCSNVKFPLITVAALQFLSRVSILTRGRTIVKVDVIGPDPDQTSHDAAKRLATHMSYQLLEQTPHWIDDDEKAKFSASIMGCAFKKTFPDTVEGVVHSEFVTAANLVVDYFTKDLSKANRVTQVLQLTFNELAERERRDLFLPMIDDRGTPVGSMDSNLLKVAKDESQGVHEWADTSSPIYEILEQHTWLDLDGDGYQEPHIVSVRSDTGQVLRIVARFYKETGVYRKNDMKIRQRQAEANQLKAKPDRTPEDDAQIKLLEAEAQRLEKSPTNLVIRIVPYQYYTKYTFIPSPDGGFYDLGFGALLGPLNDSVNTLLNQMIDSGTMNTTAGGFLGRGVKMKGGKTTFDPFEWKPVDSTGDDLRKSIFPLPVREPSATLFQMLGLLISYSEKISGATDIMTGVSPGQNTPAETSRNTIEQGMKIFSGIYGRMHRAFALEIQKLYMLNQIFLRFAPDYETLVAGSHAMLNREDYTHGKFRIAPSADPNTVSQAQRQQKAAMVNQDATHTPPGLYNMYLVKKELLEAFDIDSDRMLPDPNGKFALKPMPNPKIELEKAKLDLQEREGKGKIMLQMAEMKNQMQLDFAKIAELEARATKELSEAQGVDTGHQIALLNAQIAAAKTHQEGMIRSLELVHEVMESKRDHEAGQSQLEKENELRNKQQGLAAMGSKSGDSGV